MAGGLYSSVSLGPGRPAAGEVSQPSTGFPGISCSNSSRTACSARPHVLLFAWHGCS
jgi:hypothetical protein